MMMSVSEHGRSTIDTFVMAGGGSRGHMIPALCCIARDLRARLKTMRPCEFYRRTRAMGQRSPDSTACHGFPIEWIENGGLKRVSLRETVSTLTALPLERGVIQASRMLRHSTGAAVFSAGYVWDQYCSRRCGCTFLWS